jgi:serine phosphatase RsbU (regulator of sigma subunit)
MNVWVGAAPARRWVSLTSPSPAVTDAEEVRRARMLCTLTLALALLLSVSSVISVITSALFPGRSRSLGYGGTAIVAAAAVLFWVALWQSRKPRYEIGAWLTIATIDAFVLGLGPFFHGASATLAIGFAVPVLCATLFLHARGTVAVFGLSAVLVIIYLIIAAPSATQFSFIFAITFVVTLLTVLVAYIREEDLAKVKLLRQLELRDADRLRGELELASKVQRAMLPDHVPAMSGLDVAGFSEAAFEASGDFYDLFHVGPPGRYGAALGVVVCDVAGKGVASALVMSATRAALRAEAERTGSPAAVLAKVNDILAASVPPGLFVTIFYGIFDPATRTLRFSSAGHPHPYRGSASRDGIDELESYGLPLGLVPGSLYEDRTAVLEPGDFVLVYTDGLVEALNSAREMYGFDTVRQYLAGTAGQPASAQERLDSCLADMRRFIDGERLQDDVTLVTLRVPTDELDLRATATEEREVGPSLRR